MQRDAVIGGLAVDELLGVLSRVRLSNSSRSKSPALLRIGLVPVRPEMTGKIVT